MKKTFSINKGVLVDLLSNGGMFAGKNALLPILNTVCITTNGGRIKVASSDSHNEAVKYGELVSSSDNMTFCVNSKEIYSYVQLLTDESITLVYDDEAHNVEVQHGCGSMTFPVESAEEFPTLPKSEYPSKITLSGELLKEWLSKATAFCKKNDNSGVIDKFEFVNIRADEQRIAVCGATNANIYTAFAPNSDGVEPFNIVVSQVGVKAFISLCAYSNEIEVSFNDSQIVLQTEDTRIIATLCSATYPDFFRFFSMIGDEYIKIDTDKFLAATKRIISQLSDKQTAAHVSCDGQTLTLKYSTLYNSKDIVENIPCEGSPFVESKVDVTLLNKSIAAYPFKEMVVYHKSDAQAPFFFDAKDENSEELILLAGML